MTDWLALFEAGQYVAIAQALIDDTNLDLDHLREDTWAAIDDMPDLTVLEQGSLPDMCGGGGYYNRASRTIHLHPTGRRRNNFTLLHELGHHIQQHHQEWGFVLIDDVHPGLRRKVEEAVSDQIAAEVLLRAYASEDLDPFVMSPALVMSVLFANSMASRSAALRHVAQVLKNQAKWILAVADLNGRVIYAEPTYEQFPPKKGMIQPGFARLAREAEDGAVRRAFPEGMVYQRGRELHDMKVEAVLDFEGQYVFVALTPIHRFGMGQVQDAYYSCDNHGCEAEDYYADADSDWCDTCREPHCPTCRRCRCTTASGSYLCQRCFTMVTAYEAANGTHDC